VRLEDPWGSARSAADLAQVSTEMDDCDAAHALFAQALATFASIDHKRGIARVLEGFAVLAEHERQYQRALTLAGAAAAIRHAFGAAPREADQAALERLLERAWHSSPPADTRRIWETGARLSLDEAIRFALT
jgi:hypothetical protein